MIYSVESAVLQWGTVDAEIDNPSLVGAKGCQSFPLFKPGVGNTTVHNMLCLWPGPLAYLFLSLE